MIFGEGVALLCAEGKREAAIHLEQLGNILASTYHVDILCAYPFSLLIQKMNMRSRLSSWNTRPFTGRESASASLAQKPGDTSLQVPLNAMWVLAINVDHRAFRASLRRAFHSA